MSNDQKIVQCYNTECKEEVKIGRDIIVAFPCGHVGHFLCCHGDAFYIKACIHCKDKKNTEKITTNEITEPVINGEHSITFKQKMSLLGYGTNHKSLIKSGKISIIDAFNMNISIEQIFYYFDIKTFDELKDHGFRKSCLSEYDELVTLKRLKKLYEIDFTDLMSITFVVTDLFKLDKTLKEAKDFGLKFSDLITYGLTKEDFMKFKPSFKNCIINMSMSTSDMKALKLNGRDLKTLSWDKEKIMKNFLITKETFDEEFGY